MGYITWGHAVTHGASFSLGLVLEILRCFMLVKGSVDCAGIRAEIVQLAETKPAVVHLIPNVGSPQRSKNNWGFNWH